MTQTDDGPPGKTSQHIALNQLFKKRDEELTKLQNFKGFPNQMLKSQWNRAFEEKQNQRLDFEIRRVAVMKQLIGSRNFENTNCITKSEIELTDASVSDKQKAM